MKRRSFLAGAGALAAAGLACRRQRALPFTGSLQGPSMDLGHLVRDSGLPRPSSFTPTPVLIVGAGMAGLSAAWRLEGAGFRDYLLLELEEGPGGTARSGHNGVSPYPLAAHYLPAPPRRLAPAVRLLEEAGVVEGFDAKREPVYGEQYLVRSPDERIFAFGQWWEGLYLHAGESPEERRQYKAFFDEVDAWVSWRDPAGRRAFDLPRAKASDAEELRALDRLSFRQWLDARGYSSPRLRWLLDYAMRDDFGARLETASAWAGLFYFAARKEGPGEESRPLLAWPGGNGFLAAHLAKACGSRLRCGVAVTRLDPTPQGTVRVEAWDTSEHRPLGFEARRVVFAASQAMAGRMIPALSRERGAAFFQAFQASSWLVANLTLRERPAEHGFPLAWDNVIRDSAGLGYVVATHQSLKDHGPSVWTYYRAFAGDDMPGDWKRLAAMDWEASARLVLEDLERAHPDLRRHVARLDVMRWAHAMIRPRPGLLFSPVLEQARQPWRGIHFAHCDLSGFTLFEEAQDHGLRAAEEVLAALGKPAPSWR